MIRERRGIGLWIGEWIIVLGATLLWLITIGCSLGTAGRSGSSIIHKRLWSSAMERDAAVEFFVREGRLLDVTHCSIWGAFDITCGKRCSELVRQAV